MSNHLYVFHLPTRILNSLDKEVPPNSITTPTTFPPGFLREIGEDTSVARAIEPEGRESDTALPPPSSPLVKPIVEATVPHLSGKISSHPARANDGDVDAVHLLELEKRQASDSAASDSSSDNTDVSGDDNYVKQNSPLIWIRLKVPPNGLAVGVYKSTLGIPRKFDGKIDFVDRLRKIQEQRLPESELSTAISLLSPDVSPPLSSPVQSPTPSHGRIPLHFLCMIGGGYFSAMVVCPVQNTEVFKAPGRYHLPKIICHKSFHRYTTRRKQGGSQAAHDAATGTARSAGSALRRYNENALTAEIRALLSGWNVVIENCESLFVRASGGNNRRVLFGPYDGQVLRESDPRIQGFPFTTRRASQAELMRSYVELTTLKIGHIDEGSLVVRSSAIDGEEGIKKMSGVATENLASAPRPPGIEHDVHTSHLVALVRRSKASLVQEYIISKSLSASLPIYPPTSQHYTRLPTLLHLAAFHNSHAVVLTLLTKLGADPTTLNQFGQTPYQLASDEGTQDSFRVARGQLSESAWNWPATNIPSPLSREMALNRKFERKEVAERIEERNRAHPDSQSSSTSSRPELPKKPLENWRVREQGDTRGLTPGANNRLARELRARAAEARLNKFQNP